MSKEKKSRRKKGGGNGTCLLWLVGGSSLGLVTIFALVLFIIFSVSILINIFLAWQITGIEVQISRPGSEAPVAMVIAPNNVLVTPVALTPPARQGQEDASPINAPVETGQVSAPTSMPVDINPESEVVNPPPPTTTTESVLEMQQATVSALATEAVMLANGTPIPTKPVVPDSPVAGDSAPDTSTGSALVLPEEITPTVNTSNPSSPTPTPTATPTIAVTPTPYVSNNSYELIPLEGNRDSRPAPQHADLNIELREPEPIDAELKLLELSGSTDGHAPQLANVLEPEFIETYSIREWDWGANRPGKLVDEVSLATIKTTPGEPIYIPRKKQDIFQGKYYAVLLYATESHLTFAYTRDGTVAHGYSVHYSGLQVDPNLLKLYRESRGNELPGLTLDTPVGIATDQLIVAIRDKGKFMDLRSKKDWWSQ